MPESVNHDDIRPEGQMHRTFQYCERFANAALLVMGIIFFSGCDTYSSRRAATPYTPQPLAPELRRMLPHHVKAATVMRVRHGAGTLDIIETEELAKWKTVICKALSSSRTRYEAGANPLAVIEFIDEDRNYILCAFEVHPRQLVSIDLDTSQTTSDAYHIDPIDGGSVEFELKEAWEQQALVYPNGTRKGKGIHTHQLRVGPWTLHDASGRKVAEGEYYFGVKVGEWKYWEEGSTEPRVKDYGHPIPEAEREHFEEIIDLIDSQSDSTR